MICGICFSSIEELQDWLENHDDNPAEALIDAAEFLLTTPGIFVPEAGMPITYGGLNRIALAVELHNRKALAFRAMMEKWDIDRIVREIRV